VEEYSLPNAASLVDFDFDESKVTQNKSLSFVFTYVGCDSVASFLLSIASHARIQYCSLNRQRF